MQIYHEPRRLRDGLPVPFHCHRQARMGAGQMATSHLHDMVELLYAKAGAFELHIDETPFVFEAGGLAVIGAMGIHRVRALAEGVNEYLVIQFDPEWVYVSPPAFPLPALSSFMLRGAQKPCVFDRAALDGCVMPALMLDIFREFEGGERGYEAAIRASAHRLVLWLMRRWYAEDGAPLDGILEEEAAGRLQRALTHIARHYASPLHLSDMATLCGMSESAFSKFFLKHTHRHFVDYLCDLRIAKSEWLLAATGRSVTDIAYDVGFSTASYYIHRFRAVNGMTPLRFRRRFQGEGAGER